MERGCAPRVSEGSLQSGRSSGGHGSNLFAASMPRRVALVAPTDLKTRCCYRTWLHSIGQQFTCRACRSGPAGRVVVQVGV